VTDAPLAYRLMLRLLPADFRARFGDDMALLFVERRREAGDSPHARALVWTRGIADLVRHGMAERYRSDPHRPGSPRRRTPLMERLLSDLRYALRGLRQTPGFTAAAVITLALGIGANVAIFTAVNGVLLRPLPYPQPDRLVRVWPAMNYNKALAAEVAGKIPALEAFSGTSGWLFTLTGEGEPQQISGVVVSWNHFDLLGVQPFLGRTFTEEEGLAGQGDAVILNYGIWVNLFGADPDVIGRRIRLAAGEHETRRIVGVMPRGFQPLEAHYRVWAPLEVDPALSARDDSSWYVNVVVGRLAEGATVEQATAQLRVVAAELHQEWPSRFEEEDAGTAAVVGLQQDQVSGVSATLWTLLGAVGVVLLIACVNVANLLLARGSARQGDFAIRIALGATRARLVTLLLTEGAVLGVTGGLAGVLLAWLGLRLLTVGLPEDFHRVRSASIDPTVLAFAVCVSLAAVLLFAMLPAWKAASSARGGALGAASRRTTGTSRLSASLVVAEVMLSVVLVAGAGLMLRSLWEIYNDDVGFDPHGALTFRISIPENRFDAASLPGHYQQIWEAIAAVPGVQRVGGNHLLPLTDNNWNFPYSAEDHPTPEGQPPRTANHRIVTPSYFDTIGIPVLRGRGFTEQDTASSQNVGILNERMANELWPDEDPVGKQITVFGSPFTVVGVVGNVHQHGLRIEVQPEMYRPFDQWPTGGMFAIIRTDGDPMALVPSVQAAVWSIDADAPLARVRPMDEVFGESVATDRFVSTLIAAFGLLALVLGAVGVSGVTAYAVGRRLREFGVRMAIGADRATVLRHALIEGLAPAVLGVALGVVAALWSARLLAGLLYGIGVYDLGTFITVPLVLLLVAAAACALPARRASRLDPVTVLREE